MGTTRDEIREWLERGKAQGATHMIVACDTFNHEDYPVYVMPGDDVRKMRDEHSDPDKMSRVMEIYSYALDLEQQLAVHRAYNLD